MDDGNIIELFWQRDETAIAEVDEKYGSYCRTIADNILHSHEDAEECVSDTWLRAWQSIPPQRPMRLRLFLAKITRNLAFDRYRQRTAEKRGGGAMEAVLDELAECVADKSDVETEVDGRALRTCISTFLRSLPYRERSLFLRRYFYAEQVNDIAADNDMSANHVSVILRRTRKKLQQYLAKEGFFDEA